MVVVEAPPRAPDLTVRQLQVLRLVANGHTVTEIGEELGISPNAAKEHCRVLRGKFGVAKKRHLIEAARKYGMVS